MPFTPIHMGPGIFIKAVLQSSFSLMVFGWTQIVMDIQPLWVLVTGEGHLHGFSHTYLGATLLAVVAGISGKYLSELGLRIIAPHCVEAIEIRWWVACTSALIGAFTHVMLDSMMHADMAPLYPFSNVNSLLGAVSVADLHKACMYTGLVGTAIYYWVRFKSSKRDKKD